MQFVQTTTRGSLSNFGQFDSGRIAVGRRTAAPKLRRECPPGMDKILKRHYNEVEAPGWSISTVSGRTVRRKETPIMTDGE